MIALNESLEYAAEVPFDLPLATDPLTGLTGWVFTLGEVQIRLPGAVAWINVATNKIVEKGYGRFAARLTFSQTTTAGKVAIRAIVADTQPYIGSETIGELGGDVPVNGTGYAFIYLPDEVDPIYGTAIATADFTAGGLVRVCLPNASYRDATLAELNAIVNLGFGAYAFPITLDHTATRGKLYLYVTYPGAQRFEDYTEILGVGASSAEIIESDTSTVRSPIDYSDPSYRDHVREALGRLAQQFRSGDEYPAVGGLELLLGGEL